MERSTVIDRMRQALRQYRLDQPDSHTVAIYGPDDFCELHENFSEAYERKETLMLLAALKAIASPSDAMIDAGELAMESGKAAHVWQACMRAIIAEFEANQATEEDAPHERKAAFAR